MKPLLSVFILLLFVSCQSDTPRASHGFYADFFEAVVKKDFENTYLANEKAFKVLVENYEKRMYRSEIPKSESEVKELNEETDKTIEEIKENYFKRKGAIAYFMIDSIFIRRNRFFPNKYYILPFKDYIDIKDSVNIIKIFKKPMKIEAKKLKADFFSFVFDSTQIHDFTIGRIYFSEPYFYQNKALIFCNFMSHQGKSGYEKVYLFENTKGYWKEKVSEKLGIFN